MSDQTTLARAQLARHNEEAVLAESALRGERVVTLVRLAMIALLTLSQVFSRKAIGEAPKFDLTRAIIAWAYTGMALNAAWFLWRAKKVSLRRATIYPFIITTLDFAFVFAMGARSWEIEHRDTPEMGAALAALILCFSVTRASTAHVAWSTTLASLSYLGVALWIGELRPIQSSFVIACYLALGALIGATNVRVRKMFVDLRKRDNLSRFLPPQVVERALEYGDALAPTQREVTVLFSDIRDFTTLSEKLAPREVLELLDEYFRRMSQIVKGHDGTVGKFIGDGMLAFWNVPAHHPDHAARAVKAALDMRRELEDLNAWFRTRGRPEVRIGVGIHTGMVAAGMLGGADQHEYTVIGDAVNLASRVEGLTKTHKVDLLISGPCRALVGEQFECDSLGQEHVKGRHEPVEVFVVRGRKAEAEAAAA